MRAGQSPRNQELGGVYKKKGRLKLGQQLRAHGSETLRSLMQAKRNSFLEFAGEGNKKYHKTKRVEGGGRRSK